MINFPIFIEGLLMPLLGLGVFVIYSINTWYLIDQGRLFVTRGNHIKDKLQKAFDNFFRKSIYKNGQLKLFTFSNYFFC